MPESFDVAIVGGGIAGISLAHCLCPHRSVLVLEREAALGYHATGRSAAEFTRRFHTTLVGRLAMLSQDFLENPPEGFTEVELLKRRGNLLVASAEKRERLAEVFAAESAAAPGLVRMSVDEALARAPIINPDWVVDAFYDPDCWDVEVENLLQGFARSARSAGAQIVTGADLLTARREGGAWRLETTAGAFSAALLVNAAGAWVDAIATIAGLSPLGIQPLRRTAITVDLPVGVDAAALPEICEIDEVFYMKPDAGRLMVSPADATPSEPCDAQPEEIDVAYAAWYLEEATTVPVNHIAHRWAGLRTFAPDKAPVVGMSAKAEGFFWLAGQGGFGIQTSPALAELAAGLILAGTAPGRFDKAGVTAATMSPARLGG